MWGGGGGVSCNKLHVASCNTNKFITFVESVRPKKVYHIRISMDVECYIDVAQVTEGLDGGGGSGIL